MTDEQNNPNNPSEEDWAMSEPDPPVKEKIEAKQKDENVARLYAPLETGELDDWDLPDAPPADLIPPEIQTEQPEQPQQQQPEQQPEQQQQQPAPPQTPVAPENSQSGFIPPPNTFEILKPEKHSSSGEDWGVSPPPKNDGWKMPEPIFRASEGRRLQKETGQTAAPHSAQTFPVEENLPDLYLPPEDSPSPETDDLPEEFLEDFDSSEALPETVDQLEIPAEQVPAGSPAEGPPTAFEEPAGKSKGKKRTWLFVLLGILLFGGVALLVILGAFGLFFYSSQK